MKKVHAKIEEAKAKLGLSSRALSVRIGHHASYLSQIRVLSTQKQERLIRELNAAIDGEKVKTDSQIIDELKDAKNDAINLNVIISDLEAYKKQAAFDLTEARDRINDLKNRLEIRRKENRNLVDELTERKEEYENLKIKYDSLLIIDCKSGRSIISLEKQLKTKSQLLESHYQDLDNLEKTLDEVCNQRDQSIENNKALAEYLDILDCQVKRFGAYIFLLIVTLSITLIAFLIYVQSH